LIRQRLFRVGPYLFFTGSSGKSRKSEKEREGGEEKKGKTNGASRKPRENNTRVPLKNKKKKKTKKKTKNNFSQMCFGLRGIHLMCLKFRKFPGRLPSCCVWGNVGAAHCHFFKNFRLPVGVSGEGRWGVRCPCPVPEGGEAGLAVLCDLGIFWGWQANRKELGAREGTAQLPSPHKNQLKETRI